MIAELEGPDPYFGNRGLKAHGPSFLILSPRSMVYPCTLRTPKVADILQGTLLGEQITKIGSSTHTYILFFLDLKGFPLRLEISFVFKLP